MNIEIHQSNNGPWALVACDDWDVAVFYGTGRSVILTLRTEHGLTSLQHVADRVVEMGLIVAAVYGMTIDVDELRAAIAAGLAAIAIAAAKAEMVEAA